MPEVKVGVGLHNRFDFEVRTLPSWYRTFPRAWWPSMRKALDRVPGLPAWLRGSITQTAVAENVVLNQAFTRASLGLITWWTSGGFSAPNISSANYSCTHLGSGTTTPAITQTGLTTYVFGASNTWVSGTHSADNTLGTLVQRVIIDAGQRIGDVYREVGLAVGALNTAGYLTTRALIKDGNGDPLTITKVDLQVVTVTSTLFVQLSHNYGPNLMFTKGAAGKNAILGVMVPKISSDGLGTPRTYHFCTSTDGSAVAATDGYDFYTATKANFLANGRLSVTPTIDTANKRVTFSTRVPSTVSGTIREFGLGIETSWNMWMPMFRLVLPIGDNSPAYDNVFAASSIAKDSTNVVDVSFVLQFGSL